MNDSSLPPILASVLYLHLAEFAAQSVAEQARLRGQLVACARKAVQGLVLSDRVVLESPDGLLVVVFDDPRGALEAAERCLREAEELSLHVGIDHGPVVPVAEGEAVVGMIGGGIAGAAMAAGFAPVGELRATRAFLDALAGRAPERATLLEAAGLIPGRNRQELFAPGPRSPAQRRRGLLAIAGGFALALLLLALGGRQLMVRPAVLVLEIEPHGQVQIDGKRLGDTPPLRELKLEPGSHRVVIWHGEQEPLRRRLELVAGERHVIKHDFLPPATLLFDIQPGGEVFIDGASRGLIPGLEKLELEPLADYQLEVRLDPHPPLSVKLSPKPGQQLRVKYRFVEEKPEPPAPAKKKKGKR